MEYRIEEIAGLFRIQVRLKYTQKRFMCKDLHVDEWVYCDYLGRACRRTPSARTLSTLEKAKHQLKLFQKGKEYHYVD